LDVKSHPPNVGVSERRASVWDHEEPAFVDQPALWLHTLDLDDRAAQFDVHLVAWMEPDLVANTLGNHDPSATIDGRTHAIERTIEAGKLVTERTAGAKPTV